MAKNISLLGADYPDVPAVQLPQTGGGTAMFIDPDELAITGTITNVKVLSSGSLVSYYVDETGWYRVHANTGNTAGDLLAGIYNSSNSPLFIIKSTEGQWGNTYTAPFFLRKGTTIKAQCTYPNNGGGAIERIT